jgi:Flp pilus assembly protein TadG
MSRRDDVGMSPMKRIRLGRPTRSDRNARRRGQALVEFSLVIPIFLVVLVAVIEFALALNAVLGTNFASSEAALAAAESGSASDSDCVILRRIVASVDSPMDDARITNVRVFKATTTGVDTGTGNDYDRAGTMSCPLTGNPTATVPFRRVTAGYTESTRCNYLLGCKGPVRPLDHVGVKITYNYLWHTPLSYLLGMGGTGYTIVKANAMRMEPVL